MQTNNIAALSITSPTDYTGALVIDTGTNVVTNSGTLEASGSGGLVIDSGLANFGSLWADGGNITLHGDVSGSATISGVATLEFGGADTVIQVSTHGGGAAGVDQTFVLQGVDVTTLGADGSAIISSLLAGNKLIVDA